MSEQEGDAVLFAEVGDPVPAPMEVLVNRWKRNPYGLVVRLLIFAVCAAITSRAGAAPPVGRTIKLTREAELLSFGTAATAEGSVVAWVARRPNGITVLKAAWIPWTAAVAGEVMTLAKDVGGLPPQSIVRDDGSVWIIYADGKPTRSGPTFPSDCIACSIQARIISAAGPVDDTPVTLAVPDGLLHEFRAGARPDGGLFLWWHNQGSDAINHQSTRAFDSQGIPLAEESELPGGGEGRLAVADEGGALLVAVAELSEQGLPYMQLTGLHFDNDGAFLHAVELTPPVIPSIEEFDVSRAAAGGYWLTWRESRVGGVKLRARRVAAGGGPGRVIIAGADPTAAPLAPTPDDGFLVCWVSHGRLFARLHGADARPRSGPILIARGAPASLPLQLAVTAAGRGVVAWSSQPARDRSQALFLTRFTVQSWPTR
jgi:hypothetical protein